MKILTRYPIPFFFILACVLVAPIAIGILQEDFASFFITLAGSCVIAFILAYAYLQHGLGHED